MNYVEKKRRVINALNNYKLGEIFKITAEDDEMGVLFQAQQNIANSSCIISIELRNNDVSIVYFALGKLNNLVKKESMLELLNEFNKESSILKFYLDDDNAIIAMLDYIDNQEEFDANNLISFLGIAFNLIQEKYFSKIMRVMWA